MGRYDSTSNALAGIPGGLRNVIVGIGMNHKTESNQLADFQPRHFIDLPDVASCIGDQILHISRVVFDCLCSPMRFAGRVVVTLGAGGIGGAAVANFMHVKTVLAGRNIAGQYFETYFVADLGHHDITLHRAARTWL